MKKINNSDYLILSGDSEKITVKSGRAYLYAVEKKADGTTGARKYFRDFAPDSFFFNVAGNEKYTLIVTGIENTTLDIKAGKYEAERKAFKAEIDAFLENLDVVDQQDLNSSIRYQQLSDENYENSLENISSVLNRHNDIKNIYNEADSLLVRAFKIVAHYKNIEVKQTDFQEYKSNKTGVQALAKDNTIRAREVVLRDKWYEKDNGHLIVFLKKEGEVQLEDAANLEADYVPAAIIFRKNKYRLINAENGNETDIDEEIASRIYPMAFMLYEAINDEKITLKRICTYVLRNLYKDLIFYIGVGFLCTLIGLLTPMLTRNFIDHVIPNAARNQALQICTLVFMCNISLMFGKLAQYFANLRMSVHADAALEAAIVDRLLKLPVNFFKNYTAGDMAARAGAITQVKEIIFSIALSVFMNFIYSFVYLIQEYHYCAYLAKWGIILCLVPVLISVISVLITYRWEKELIDCEGKITGMLLQFMNGIEKITNSNSGHRVFSEWSKEYIRQTKISYTMQRVNNVIAIISSFYPTLVTMFFYLLYGRALNGQQIQGLSTGTFMAFLTAFGSFQSAIMGLTGAFTQIRNLVQLSKRIKPIMECKPEISDTLPAIKKLQGNIEINHLNFRYSDDGPLVLNDVSMEIKKGEFVAIVGGSGAGKSTLLRMLIGFEKPESGAIFYDNQDMNSYDIGSIRRQMGVVLQNDSVLSGTILSNIVGTTGLKEEDAWEAARAVAFDKDIEEMPMGMFTMIPAGGMSLSGGQLQRLIIARALIRKPELLIFDEATSALDNLTQQVVRESLDKLHVTRIIIAHRLSTIINADKIYVMKEGKVIESGNYEELMKQNGYFAELSRRQSV